MSDLGTLGGSDSNAIDINDADKVVGIASTSEHTRLIAFLYSDGVMRDLNSLIPADSGWELDFGRGHQRQRQYRWIWLQRKSAQLHAFLLTPVP